MNDAGVLSPSKSSRPGQHLLLVISQFVSSNSALHKLGSLSILYICDNVIVVTLSICHSVIPHGILKMAD